MTVISLGRSLKRVKRDRIALEEKVKEQVKITEQSVLASRIASSRRERAAVELIRDRERLAEAGL